MVDEKVLLQLEGFTTFVHLWALDLLLEEICQLLFDRVHIFVDANRRTAPTEHSRAGEETAGSLRSQV